jgi:uncharacterized protein DUF4126
MPILPVPFVALGQIITVAFASGLNLYLTIAVIATGSRFNLLPALPASLQGIQNPVVIASALALFLIEFIIDKVPHADSVWDVLHTIVRPLGTALLVVLALEEMPTDVRAACAVLAALVALGAHGTKAFLRLVANRSPSGLRNASLSLFEDLCAAALASAALLYPAIAPASAAGIALVLLFLGPRLRRAGVLALQAFSARLQGFFGSSGFRAVDDLPRGVRRRIAVPPIGQAKPRALRAALKGMPGIPSYRVGWVVVCYDRTVFVHQGWIFWHAKPFPTLSEARLRRGTWTDAIEFRLNKRRHCTVFLLKDGPTAEVALAGLTGNNQRLLDSSAPRPKRA